MTGTALRLRGIAHAAGGRPILAGIDLDLPPASSLALLGANGSGKTTLLRIAAGLRQPRGGHAELGDGTATARAVRQGRIGYIPQHLGLVRHATALQNACMGGLAGSPWWRTLLGRPSPDLVARARSALEAVGLSRHEHALVRDLSGGERQRTAIARSIVQEPELLVADELVASLDTRQVRQALQHLDRLKAGGCTVVASMHQVEAALQWADQVAVLAGGKMVGPRPAARFTAEEVRCLVEG